MGIVALVRRDAEQGFGSQEYESSYNESEKAILKTLDKYGDVAVPLTDIASNPDLSCSLGVGSVYVCNYTNNPYSTHLTITDTNKVEDFELGKDETFKVQLNSTYRGKVYIGWEGDAAIAMTIEAQGSNLVYESINDVYDNKGILSESGTSAADHAFNYAVPDPAQNYIVVTISGITGIAATDKPLYLKIRPLMKNGTSIRLNVTGDAGFPNQVRKVEAYSYLNSNNVPSSTPILITQIPLAGKEPEIINYVLRVENEIVK